jgi:hypothetical protein
MLAIKHRVGFVLFVFHPENIASHEIFTYAK